VIRPSSDRSTKSEFSEQPSDVGEVLELWRYPVKSMLGEALETAPLTRHGLLGDRMYGIVEAETGRVASAKNTRKWPRLFDYAASYVGEPRSSEPSPPVRITFPDGRAVTTQQPDLNEVLSNELERELRLERAGDSWTAAGQDYTFDERDLRLSENLKAFELPPGTFFDSAPLHLITTATLNRLRTLHPEGDFDVRRFRPNLVIETPAASEGFVENQWIGRTFSFGEGVRLQIIGPCARCVMPALQQSELPKDPEILRTAVRHNAANVGVYAVVLREGDVRLGDAVVLE
jgi:uncharacterized protein YcbX